jgi:hypothetical protein
VREPREGAAMEKAVEVVLSMLRGHSNIDTAKTFYEF